VDQLGLLGEDFENTNDNFDEDFCLPPNESMGDSGEDNVTTTPRRRKEPNKSMIKYTRYMETFKTFTSSNFRNVVLSVNPLACLTPFKTWTFGFFVGNFK
jgi:hypothetical protein